MPDEPQQDPTESLRPDSDPAKLAARLQRERAAAPLDDIGPYKVLEKIGEGGMGTVYVAEQRAPVRRRVALKVIKLGMDTKEVLARFEIVTCPQSMYQWLRESVSVSSPHRPPVGAGGA